MDIAQPNSHVEPFYRQISAENFHGGSYQDQVIALRRGPYLDFPATLSIETISLCNAACNFCPYPSLDRKGERMPDELIEKILNEVEEIPGRPPFKITLARVNEPFLDTRIFDISHEIERRFPEATSFFFSNGTPLTEKNLLRLAKLQRVDYLNISVNEYRKEQYERTMRLPFDHTLSRLEMIQRMKGEGIFKFPVFLSRVGDGTVADAEYLEWVQAKYPSLNGLVTVRGNWLGKIKGDVAAAPDVACRQWFELHILANGRTAFCCIDSEGSHGMGDARYHHVVHEVYNHPARRKLRAEANSRRTVDPCNTCPMLP